MSKSEYEEETRVTPVAGCEIIVTSRPGRVIITAKVSLMDIYTASLMPEEVAKLEECIGEGDRVDITAPGPISVTWVNPSPNRTLLILNPRGLPSCESDFCRNTLPALRAALMYHSAGESKKLGGVAMH